mgnify:FL=1
MKNVIKFFILSSLFFIDLNAQSSMNFVGDIMLGRRYYCTAANSYNNNNQDLENNLCLMPDGFCDGFGSPGIIPSCGTNVLFNGVKSYFQNSDFINIGNLESVITLDTSTPHLGYETCKIVFHSCPDVVPELVDVNFDFLNLGNNHVLDYMSNGIISTNLYLNDAEISYGGSGLDSLSACAPSSLVNDNGVEIFYLSSSSVNGEDEGDSCEPLSTSGENNPGFCEMSEQSIDNQMNYLGSDLDSSIVVYQMHTGYEYSFEPEDRSNLNNEYNPFFNTLSDRTIEMAHYAVDAGADIVVQHHPHVIQGFELYNNKLIAHSLGNFIFDQNFPETWSSLILNADFNHNGFNSYKAIPIYLNYYLPQIASGTLGNYILDFLSMKSRKLNTFIKVDRESNIANVEYGEPYYTFTKDTTLVLEEDSSGSFISKPIKLNKNFHIEDIISNQDIEYRLGREIIWMGDFDFNPEVDSCINKDTYYWNMRTSFLDSSVFWNGNFSLKMIRNPSNTDNALVDNYYCFPLINEPEEISVRGYIKTENSNDTKIGVRFYESRCSGTIETQYTSDVDGTTEWQEYSKDIIVPDDSRYIDLRMVSFPTDSLESISYFDNVGIIEWEEWSLSEVLYPNDYYYYQIKSSSNQVDITLEEKSYYFGEQFSIGDNNFDGSIDVIDIILIINISIDIYIPSNEEFAASDANQDGSVNVLDIIELINIIISN